ncbi:MAG TPA: methylmalonyl-CoA mutase family protein, partial [Pyrinomonadaceae bacterium]|nr:methylmalonyl-CoA mutase family protein [Pyrinomonadaceae bacterium]
MQELKEASSEEQIKRNRWEETTLQKSLKRQPERTSKFQTVSLADIARLYDPTDVADVNFDGDISFPGEFPYTRGIHATGYRGKLWTMRQFAGFGTPEETNARFKYLLKEGQTGLSVAYDLPALMGYDADST